MYGARVAVAKKSPDMTREGIRRGSERSNLTELATSSLSAHVWSGSHVGNNGCGGQQVAKVDCYLVRPNDPDFCFLPLGLRIDIWITMMMMMMMMINDDDDVPAGEVLLAHAEGHAVLPARNPATLLCVLQTIIISIMIMTGIILKVIVTS